MRLERGALALLTGLCLTTAALAQTPLRLLVWINGDKGYNGLQKVGDAFARESGVQVVVQHPEGAPDKFTAAAAAGKGPDIMCWAHDRVGEWAKSGPGGAGAAGQGAARAQIDDAAWAGFTYRGQTLGLPAGHRDHRPDLQQGAGGHAADELRADHRDRPAAQGTRQGRHPLGLQQQLLQLAAAGRAGRFCLRPHAAG
jgi:ABC-type glycerol-3-phosphate transport system substrate-binding protein